MLICSDRACKACTQSGKEHECTHRKPPEPENAEGGEQRPFVLSIYSYTQTLASANGSSSSIQLQISPVPHHIPHPHPHYTLGPLPYYPTSPVGPDQLPPMVTHVIYRQDQAPMYLPVIDPNIDAPSHATAENSQNASIPPEPNDASASGH